MKNIKLRLTVMNFLEFAVWGAYLTSMGRYLASFGMADNIGWFYSIQGIVSLFMPALMGIVADRWIPAQKALSLCHGLAGAFMIATGAYALMAGEGVLFATLFSLYTASVAFFMPTLALSNSVAYTALTQANLDTVKAFPPIRVLGTVGFIVTMWIVDLCGFQANPKQFVVSGGLSLVLALYSLTLPACPVKGHIENKSLVEALGLESFALFKQKKMAVFFVFSMLLGMCLQITNGYANMFLGSFEYFKEWTTTFGVQHSNILISISQICEALCILFIPFFLKRFGIKSVMLMAMFAWVLRFALFGAGNPGMPGVILFVLSCIVYGFAFDFFNISGSLYVDQETDPSQRSSAQGLFVMMTNGFGATIGTLSAQAIVNRIVPGLTNKNLDVELGVVRDDTRKILWENIDSDKLGAIQEYAQQMWAGWQTSWYIFAGFALVVALAFWVIFPKTPVKKD
ncbi:MAG: MFS transporter [Paludibacteraceae bacterium]|nr:MFS transporter [Paludibacteraceae bacterium]